MTGTGQEREYPGWTSQIPVNSSVTLPPDPHVVDAIGGNHRLETAVADLVDNAIDAAARNVLLRFVVADGRVRAFYVVDDGRGMTGSQIDAAMTFGGVRQYQDQELGHFGLGLKAASFSQADSLTVVSVSEDCAAVGRRWLMTKANRSFECDVVGYGFCGRELRRPWGIVTPEPGTVVRWDDIRTFPTSDDPAVADRFVQDATVRLRQHLGLVFHRFLTAGTVKIGIDVEDVGLLATGPVAQVEPIDPFGYTRTGATGYPKSLQLDVEGTAVTAVCHVWPGRSQLAAFRLPGAEPTTFQGLYFYRRERLLQTGGWNNLEVSRRDLQLARVAIDLDDDLVHQGAFRMNPEKSRVDTRPAFSDALERAAAPDGTTFRTYLEVALRAQKVANQRVRTRTPTIPLGKGVPARLRRVAERELTFLPNREDVDIRWCDFVDDVFFDVDLQTCTVWLNSRYRTALGGEGRANVNDAPVVKTLLFLLVEKLFHGSYLGTKEKDDLLLWQAVLTAAAQEELR